MKKLLWLLPMVWAAVLLLTWEAWAASLVCDPQAGVTHYKMTGPSWMPTTTPAQADGSVKLDVNAAIVGVTNMTIAACVNDPVWGEQCSSFVPFSFPRPGPPSTPTGERLVP